MSGKSMIALPSKYLLLTFAMFTTILITYLSIINRAQLHAVVNDASFPKVLKHQSSQTKIESAKAKTTISWSSPELQKVKPKIETYPHCKELICGNASDEMLENAKMWRPSLWMNDSELAIVTNNCSQFQLTFGFTKHPRSRVEADRAHAYAILIHKDAFRVIQMLQLIYWPQNWYCIHVDSKQKDSHFLSIFKNLAACYKNILLSSEMYRTEWGSPEILAAAVNCLKVLNTNTYSWTYVNIYSGNDVPLRTNREVVEITNILNGTNIVELAPSTADRVVFNYSKKSNNQEHDIPNRIPPGGLIPYKGSFQAFMSKDFVNFILESEISKQFLEFLMHTAVPDESYWATMNGNVHLNAPGSFPGVCLKYFEALKKPNFDNLARHQVWNEESCLSGKLTYSSCVFGVKDLPNIVAKSHLALHKMYLDFEPAAFTCLAEDLLNRTFDEGIIEHKSVDILNVYRSHILVKYNRLVDKSKFRCV